MSYCVKCGAYIPDLEKTCPACGATRITAEAEAAAAAWAEQKQKKEQEPKKTEYHYTYNYNTAEKTESEKRQAEPPKSSYSERMDDDAAQNKGLCALCYLWLLFIIPWALRPSSPFVRYHVNQGIVLALLWVVAEMCFSVPLIGWIAGIVGNLLAFICTIKGIVTATQGKCEPLPLIGGVSILK